jgi:hypothetical protein
MEAQKIDIPARGFTPLVIVLNNKMKVPKSPPLGGLTVNQ